MVRYVDENNYVLGNIIKGKKKPVYKLHDFLISQLDDEFISNDLFEKTALYWEDENYTEEYVKKMYDQLYHQYSKKLYEDTMTAHINMRKKKTSKAKPKRKVVKKCRCK